MTVSNGSFGRGVQSRGYSFGRATVKESGVLDIYPARIVAELVAAPKCLPEGKRLEPIKIGERGGKFDINLVRKDGLFVDFRFVGGIHNFN